MELLGGKLELQSERGIGSRFFFQIPLPSVSCPEIRNANEAGRTRLKLGFAVRALVVDDRKENGMQARGGPGTGALEARGPGGCVFREDKLCRADARPDEGGDAALARQPSRPRPDLRAGLQRRRAGL